MQRSELELAVEYGWKALRVWGEKSPSSKLGWAIATGSLFARFALERLGFATPKRSAADLAYKVAAYDKLFRAYFFLDPLRTFYCTLRLWRLTAISDDYEAMACAKSGVAMMIGVAGMRRWAFELFAEARRDADTANSSWWRGTVEMRRSVVSRMDGRWDVEPLDEAIEALRDAGDMFDLGAAVFHAAEVCFQKGCIDEAFERARAFNAATSRVEPGAPPSVVGSRIMEAICRVLRGEPDLGRFEHEYGVALSRKDIIVRTSVLHEWADGLVATGRLEEAVQTLEDAYRLWKKHRLIDAYTSQLLFKLPRAYLALPQLDRRQLRQLRRAHHEALRKTRRRHVGWRAPTLVNQALLLERAGKRAKADGCFQKAIDLARRQNAGLFVAKGLYEWGVMLSARGDAAAGAARLHEALHLAEAGGNVWLATLCRSALPRASD
jgi:tetratricopeptide (TPR) repeat protein